ncbi:hypothetical protein INT43_001503 [Umbelopsis isabellina]|uniref:Uncharacterized protein n=1 Tax=Mortierella isabellina TaxID=91625 RepID=A0A8H7U6V0_MORIS|nr:hypothetical protein INT43_001503 [Umbelopsis isabellina]
MGDGKSKTLHKITRWGSASNGGGSTRTGAGSIAGGNQALTLVEPLDPEDLKQGQLYIVKISLVKLALFEGWQDDMCCWSVLRDESKPMRWSEARYLPGDFFAYEAFDEAGNPPVYIWQRLLNTDIPANWFSMFEEARRKQREWASGFDQVQSNGPTYQLADYPQEEPHMDSSVHSVRAADQQSVNTARSEPQAPADDREKLRNFLVGEQAPASFQRNGSLQYGSTVEDSAPHSPVPSHISQIPVAPASVDGTANKHEVEELANGDDTVEKAGQTQAKYDDSIDFPHDQHNFSIPDYPTAANEQDSDNFKMPPTTRGHRPSVRNILKTFKQHEPVAAGVPRR